MIDSSISSKAKVSKPVHPFLFSILILPYGVSSGYVSVTIGFLLSQAGVSVEKIAALVAVSILPSVLKFLWAPLVDTVFSFKKWYWIGSIIGSIGIFATGILPFKESSLPQLTVIVFLCQIAITFLCMATDGLMAYNVPDTLKGRASGFFQAGNLGGVGLGGGLGLYLSQRLPAPWMTGAILAVICLSCSLALFFFNDPKISIREARISNTYKNLFNDVWNTIKTKSGSLGLLLCFLTLCTGAASNLFAAIGKDWFASADTIALVTGVAGGLLSAVGCLIGGWICDRMDSRNAYLLFGLAGAACIVGMGYAPRTEMMFIVWTSLYAIATGLGYAGFTAFTLEAIGKGAAATKFNIFTALSNSPIYLMTYIVGIAYTHFGAKGMFNTEAGFAVASVVLFILIRKLVYRHQVMS